MFTLSRFQKMADSYGGDLQRWPEEVRGEALALLSVSPQARACLDEALMLDGAIAAASARSAAAARRRTGEDGAALARLRAGVAARVAAPLRRHQTANWRFSRGPSERVRGFVSAHIIWIGMVAGGSLAVIAGFLIGVSYATAPAPDVVLGMLQPIHILAE